MKTTISELKGHPMAHGWMPHEPQTWRYRFASLKYSIVGQRWNQRKPGLPEYTDVPMAAGQRVKIVMVSRLGDVGITDDLTEEN